jgi:hypothetical protein
MWAGMEKVDLLQSPQQLSHLVFSKALGNLCLLSGDLQVVRV